MSQTLLFIVVFLVIVSLFGSMQYRLYRLIRRWVGRAYSDVNGKKLLSRILWAIVFLNALFFVQLAVRATSVYQLPLVQAFLIYPMGIFFAIVVFAFLIVTLFDLVRPLFWLAKRIVPALNPVANESPLDPGRRRFLRLSGYTAASVVGSLPAIASAATARDYQINRIPLVYPNLPSGLEGLTIAQVSDLHSGVYMTESNMKEVFEITNSLNAQMIMVTGDFVDSSDSQIDPLFKSITMLKAEYGVFGCLGNHDHFATAPKVSAAVEEAGITMLNNAHTNVVVNGEIISVIGVDDAGRGPSHFTNWPRSLNGVDPESFRIALTHRPDEWDTCRNYGVDLTLAGHTHGGQVGFKIGPLNLNPVYLIHKYAMGHYSKDDKHLYVNVGVGMVLVPIRLVKPEISLFTLTRPS